MSRAPILATGRKHWLAVGAVSVVCAVAVGGAVLTANIHAADLVQEHLPTSDEVQVLAQAPNALTPTLSLPNQPLPGVVRPVVAHGLLITSDGDTVSAIHPDGTRAWHYERSDAPLCSLGVAWGRVVATYRTGVGCGDVVAIDAQTGQYAHTRSAINSAEVSAISSNDRIGTVSAERAELWRSDLVRTVEYGFVEAKQEPNKQPHEDCVLGSALTRKETFAITETCDGDDQTTWLRLLDATPEDSRAPEVDADVEISSPGVRLVAIGQEAAAVYVPGPQPQIRSFSKTGAELAASNVPASPAAEHPASPFVPATADLPHHMTWFDGERLHLLSPTRLSVERTIEQAIGTGVAVGERLLAPTRDGIAVIDWSTGDIERTIPVDRQGYTGPVYLAMAGTSIVEARGNELVVLSAS
ncbi:hypothetical protein G7Y31_03115 [Corynebacterium lizhenjunii]|uniref:Uncharacterized protein n=1 Tax=Corynebacterium lizhenjunii TaxID=2709394 RepID=A0A7T0KFQ5_9CORY|nr:hypothetical protein [Corynebacterium lizhenjunii]QPK79709.1 hypothetical protein G7Y31_03115 [Corynebacterium lizhenjunii]